MQNRFFSNTVCSMLLGLLLCGSWSAARAQYDQEELVLNRTQLLIKYSASLSLAEREKLKAWLDSVTATMLLLHGEPSRPKLRIVLEAYPTAKGPVPFGKIIRRDPEGVKFYVNPNQSLDNFISDWTAYHELTHLYIPYPGQADIWFSEGLASYYQNVMQYRAGLLSETEAWQKLVSGFERGRKDNRAPDLTLTQLSAELRSRYAFMRVYWSGALYFLEADMRLRAATDNTQSTDTVLRAFGECCLNSRRRWNGLEIATEFDRISGQDIFVSLFSEYAESTAMPDYTRLIETAGLQLADGLVSMNPKSDSRHDLAGLGSRPARSSSLRSK